MRFMMLMIPKVYQGAEGRRVKADFTPSADAVERMTRFNEELVRAGALIALDGLHPPEKGARVSFQGGKARVTDGPFAESKEVLGGYWLIQAESKEEAVEWARKCPADDGDVIEIRQVFETSDWPEDARKAAESPALQAALTFAAGCTPPTSSSSSWTSARRSSPPRCPAEAGPISGTSCSERSWSWGVKSRDSLCLRPLSLPG